MYEHEFSNVYMRKCLSIQYLKAWLSLSLVYLQQKKVMHHPGPSETIGISCLSSTQTYIHAGELLDEQYTLHVVLSIYFINDCLCINTLLTTTIDNDNDYKMHGNAFNDM